MEHFTMNSRDWREGSINGGIEIMARVTLFPPSVGIPYFYNVDSAVGPGCPNLRDDVLLVQYLLVTINDNPNAFSPPFPPLPLKPGETFRADGIVGPITLRAIQHFQEVGRTRGNNIATDGRVDKATGSGAGATSHTQFTIIFLNNGYRIIRPGMYPNIALLAGDCPSELRAPLTLT
jgi:hypothetical protein